MTQPFQPGQHPDADQLSAFAEHALPPHEQQQTLAHLATCADCRSIVYTSEIAHPSDLVEAAPPAPVAARRPWFSGWNLALPAALALAALVLITVHLRRPVGNQSQAASNTAHLDQPAQPAPTQPATPTIAAAQREVTTKPLPAPILKPRAAASGATTFAPAKPTPTPPTTDKFGPYALASNQSSARSVNPDATSASGAALGGQASEDNSAVTGRNTQALFSLSSVRPAPPSPQQAGLSGMDGARREVHSSATQYNSIAGAGPGTLNQAAQVAPLSPAPHPPPATVTQTVTVSNASATLETESAASSPLVQNRAYAPLPLAVLKAKKQPSLPSHLPTAATIANARQVLAIDTAGALFRSQDAGVTWQLIPTQWSGRALKLQLVPLPEARQFAKAEGAATPAPAAQPASPVPLTFELTTTTGEVWASTDGQAWQRK